MQIDTDDLLVDPFESIDDGGERLAGPASDVEEVAAGEV